MMNLPIPLVVCHQRRIATFSLVIDSNLAYPISNPIPASLTLPQDSGKEDPHPRPSLSPLPHFPLMDPWSVMPRFRPSWSLRFRCLPQELRELVDQAFTSSLTSNSCVRLRSCTDVSASSLLSVSSPRVSEPSQETRRLDSMPTLRPTHFWLFPRS
jgi:hypothetical protein